MAERLTKKDKPILKNQMEDNMPVNESTAIKRLWKYETIMEKYGIESFELLEHIIKKGKVINSVIEDFAKEEYDKMKKDRNDWRNACKLACKKMNNIDWACHLECQSDECFSKNDKDIIKCLMNYFYQQAKKEGYNDRLF